MYRVMLVAFFMSQLLLVAGDVRELRRKPHELRLGLAYDQDFLGTLTMGKLRFSPAFRQKYQVARYCNLDNTPQTP